MKGRDLIIYILQNNLEDEEIFKDGKLVGYMSVVEAAMKFEVGMATINAWYEEGMLTGLVFDNRLYIPENAERPNGKVITNPTVKDLQMAYTNVLKGNNQNV